MTMAGRFYDFDPAEMLGSDEAIEVFLTEAMCTGDAKFIASALALWGCGARERLKTVYLGTFSRRGGLSMEMHRTRGTPVKW
jgi:DNA-binding phage protein